MKSSMFDQANYYYSPNQNHYTTVTALNYYCNDYCSDCALPPKILQNASHIEHGVASVLTVG
eukprot:5355757-Amphidinium_carterae.1